MIEFNNRMTDEELIDIEEELLVLGDDFRCMPLSQCIRECEKAGELMITACSVIKTLRNDLNKLIELRANEPR